MIEDKMIKAQIAKEDATLDKYNVDAVTSFMKTLLADLGETYKRSSLSQIKVLIGSIFPLGVAWSSNGTLNHTISPLYQAIRTFEKSTISSSAEDDFYFEPHFTNILTHFIKFMETYQAEEGK